MKRWFLVASVAVFAAACQDGVPTAPSSPSRSASVSTTGVATDPALANALATAAPTDQLEVIVGYDEAVTTAGTLASSVLGTGAGVIGFENLPMIAALATPSQIAAIRSLSGVESVYLNRPLKYLLAESVPAIHADAVHVAGITGKGIGIAILDSGVDGLYNADLAYPRHTIANVKYVSGLREKFTFANPTQITPTVKVAATLFIEGVANSESSMGHGTHVAGIAAGTGASSGGKYTGVAPGANVIGIGTGDGPFIFWALAGFDYILKHRKEYNIRVVNNSWGTDGPFDPKDPINKASRKVHDAGVTVVFAAGNAGPGENTLNPYSVAPWVIGVAAGCKVGVPDPTNSAVHCVDGNGQGMLADFSSRGIPGDSLYHPDITAPGVHIVSARASTGLVMTGLDAAHDARNCNISVLNDPYYTCASGTSMASPHVTGVVALMQEAAGGRIAPDRVLAVLKATARPLPGLTEYQVGAGYLDALAAVNCVRNGYACLGNAQQ